jgi:hypothetical protein
VEISAFSDTIRYLKRIRVRWVSAIAKPNETKWVQKLKSTENQREDSNGGGVGNQHETTWLFNHHGYD